MTERRGEILDISGGEMFKPLEPPVEKSRLNPTLVETRVPGGTSISERELNQRGNVSDLKPGRLPKDAPPDKNYPFASSF